MILQYEYEPAYCNLYLLLFGFTTPPPDFELSIVIQGLYLQIRVEKPISEALTTLTKFPVMWIVQ